MFELAWSSGYFRGSDHPAAVYFCVVVFKNKMPMFAYVSLFHSHYSCPGLPSLLYYKHWLALIQESTIGQMSVSLGDKHIMIGDNPMTDLFQGSACFLDGY